MSRPNIILITRRFDYGARAIKRRFTQAGFSVTVSANLNITPQWKDQKELLDLPPTFDGERLRAAPTSYATAAAVNAIAHSIQTSHAAIISGPMDENGAFIAGYMIASRRHVLVMPPLFPLPLVVGLCTEVALSLNDALSMLSAVTVSED